MKRAHIVFKHLMLLPIVSYAYIYIYGEYQLISFTELDAIYFFFAHGHFLIPLALYAFLYYLHDIAAVMVNSVLSLAIVGWVWKRLVPEKPSYENLVNSFKKETRDKLSEIGEKFNFGEKEAQAYLTQMAQELKHVDPRELAPGLNEAKKIMEDKIAAGLIAINCAIVLCVSHAYFGYGSLAGVLSCIVVVIGVNMVGIAFVSMLPVSVAKMQEGLIDFVRQQNAKGKEDQEGKDE